MAQAIQNVTLARDDDQHLTAHKVDDLFTAHTSVNNDNVIDITKNQTRQFNCAMNPMKQLDKVINDATLPPLTVEINNAGQNVNIKCNSGLYAAYSANPTASPQS